MDKEVLRLEAVKIAISAHELQLVPGADTVLTTARQIIDFVLDKVTP